MSRTMDHLHEVLGSLVVTLAKQAGDQLFTPTKLVVWCYGMIGIKLEDDLIWLWEHGARIIGSDLLPGDLVFISTKSTPCAGHVGIYDGTQGIVHVSYVHDKLESIGIDAFLDDHGAKYRGTRRYIPSPS